jgi:hypothetical protein
MSECQNSVRAHRPRIVCILTGTSASEFCFDDGRQHSTFADPRSSSSTLGNTNLLISRKCASKTKATTYTGMASTHSLADEATEMKATPPYFRFPLSSLSQTGLPPLPVAMEHQHVPVECWDAFWSKVQPIAYSRVDFFATISIVCLCLVAAVYFLVTAYFLISDGPHLLVYLPFWISFPAFTSIAVLSGRTKNSQLKAIRSLCVKAEQGVFRRYGYALECDYEGSDLYLYILPVACCVSDEPSATLQNGYLRMKVLDGTPAMCGWNIVSKTTLAYYDYLPNEFESLARDDWTEFWFKMTEASEDLLSSYRIYFALLWTCIFLMFATTVDTYVTGDHTVIYLAFSLFYVAGSVLFLHAARRFLNASYKPPLIVAQYAAKFAQQDVYMEYRKLMKFHWCTGHYYGYYIYLFPQRSANLALIEGGGSIQGGT